MNYKIHFQNDSLGINTGLAFENEPTKRDIYDLLVQDGHLDSNKVLDLAEGSEQERQFALDAYKNGIFDEPEKDVDWLKVGGKIIGDIWEGTGNALIKDPLTSARLTDFAKNLSGGKEMVEGQESPWQYYPGAPKAPAPYKAPVFDEETQKKVDRASSSFMKTAPTQLWTTKVGDTEGPDRELQFAMSKQGLNIEDKELRSAVANRAIALNNLQNKATNYQAVANIVGGYRMLGSMGRKAVNNLERFVQMEPSGSDADILEELRHMKVMRDTSNALMGPKGPVTGAKILQDKASEYKLRKSLRDGLIEADQAQALAMEIFADPANYFTAMGAKATSMGMRTIAKGQIDNLANQMQEASTAYNQAYRDLQELYNSNANGVLSKESYNAIEKPILDVLDQSKKALDDASKKYLDKTSGYVDAPFIQKGIGKGIEGTGWMLDRIGRTGEWLQKIPKEMAVDFLAKTGRLSTEEATKLRNFLVGTTAVSGVGAVAVSDLEWNPGWGTAITALTLALGPKFAQVVGNQTMQLGKHMAGANGSRNFFEVYQQLDTQPLISGAVVDRTLDIPVSAYEQGKKIFNKEPGVDVFSRLGARGMTKTGADKVVSYGARTASNLVENTALPGALGYAIGGEEGFVGNVASALPFFAWGATSGELLSFNSRANALAKQRGDVTNHRKNLSEEQGQLFDSLNFPAQSAMATSQMKFPNARFVLYADKDGGNGFHEMVEGQSVVHVNTLGDAPIQGIVSHEIGHHMMRHGLTPMVTDIFFGSVAKNKPGIFTAKDKDGNPIIETENGVQSYKLNDKFQDLKKAYTSRLQGSPEHIRRAYEDNYMIMEEVMAEQVAHMMLNPDKPGGFMDMNMGQLAKSLFSAMSGNGFQKDVILGTGGGVDQFGNGFFDINESPDLKKLIKDFERTSKRRSSQEMQDMIEPDAFNDVVVSPKDIKDSDGLQQLFNNKLVRNEDGTIQYGLDGIPKQMTDAQQNKLSAELSKDLSDIIESRGDNLPQGHVRMRESAEEGKTIGEGLFIDDSILDQLASNPKYSPSQINFLRQASAVGRAINNKDFSGNEVLMFYYPTMRGNKKYKSLRGGYRTALVYGIRLTKAGNVTLETLSVTGIENNINKALKSKKRLDLFKSEFGGNTISQVKESFYKDLKLYLQNHKLGIENGKPGSGISEIKRDFINAIMGENTPRQRETNSMLANLPKLESTIRSRRIDRLGSIEQTGRGGHVDYVKIRENLMPRTKDAPGQMVMDMNDIDNLVAQNPNINRKADFVPSRKSINRALGLPDKPSINQVAKALVDYDYPEYIEGTAEANHKIFGVEMRDLIEAMHKAYNQKIYGKQMPKLNEPDSVMQDLSLDELNQKLTDLEAKWRQYGSQEETLGVINDESTFSRSRNRIAHEIKQVKLAMADKQEAYINKAGTLKEIPQATIDKAIEQGYDPVPVYHGTNSRRIEENTFEPGRAGLTYFAEERSFSEGFGNNIEPYFLKGKMFDFEGNPEHRKKAIKMFNDGGGWRSLWETSGYDPNDAIGGQNPNDEAHPLIDTLPESERELVDWLKTRSDQKNPYNWDENNDLGWELFDNPENDVLSELMGEGYDTFRFIDGDGKTIARATSEPSNIKRIESDVPMDQRFDSSNSDIRYMPPVPQSKRTSEEFIKRASKKSSALEQMIDSLAIDRNVDPKDLPLDDLLSEAQFVLDTFSEGDHVNKGNRGEANKIRNLIKNFGGTKKDSFGLPPLPNIDIRYMPTISGKQNPDIIQETSNKTQIWEQTKTENFKNWFQESKLVDDEGIPQLWFHGSPTSGFSSFNPSKSGSNGDIHGPGYYFTDDITLADDYSDTISPRETPGVYPAFIKMEKPIVLEGVDGMKQTSITKQQAYKFLKRAPDILDPNGPISNWLDTDGKPPTDAQLREIAESYDGSSFMVMENDFYPGQTEVFLDNAKEIMDADGLLIKGMDGLPDVAVSWDNKNIKSAIGNKGNFDPDSADIRMLPFMYVKAEKTGSNPSQEPSPFDKRFNIGEFDQGGYFFDVETGENLNGKTFSSMSISTKTGRPATEYGDSIAQQEGRPKDIGNIVKVNMIDGRPGRYGNKFDWIPYPYQAREGLTAESLKEKYPWLISIEQTGIKKKHNRNYPDSPTDHAFALEVENMVPTTMATYPKGSNPRGRPTAYGNVVLGKPMGVMQFKGGKKHYVYDKVTILPKKGMPGFDNLEQIASNMKVVPHRKDDLYLVRVDVEAFDKIYSQDNSYVGPGGEGGIGNRYDEAKLFLAKGGGMELGQGSIYAPEGFVNKHGSAGFEDGRHRYQVLRGMGMTSMPVAMTRNSIKNAHDLGLLTKDENGAYDFRHMPRVNQHPEAFPVVQAKDKKGNLKFKIDKKGKKKPEMEKIPYDLLGSPLIKETSGKINEDEFDFSSINVPMLTGPERTKLQDLYNTRFFDVASDRMLTDYQEWMKDPEVMAGSGWYSRMRGKLKKALGQDADLFSQLLGATSARTDVEDNFIQSVDAMRQLKAGKFDNLIKRYRQAWDLIDSPQKLYQTAIKEGVIESDLVRNKDGSFKQNKTLPAKVLSQWIKKFDLVPRKSNGERFNMNSNHVMRVLAGSWYRLSNSPKTTNFAGNLTGRTLEATIDVWAIRYLRRMMYDGQDVWRIQPGSEEGVSNLDFAIGQVVFKQTANKLGINPDDLQAIAWFGEKGVWDDGGWTDSTGAFKSSFDEPFEIFFGSGKQRDYDESVGIIDYFRADRKVKEYEAMEVNPRAFDKSPEKVLELKSQWIDTRNERQTAPVKRFLQGSGSR